MSLKQLLIIAGSGVLFCQSAQADGGLYLGAGFGSATINGTDPLALVDDESDTWRAMAGFKLGESLSLDAGYHDFGNLTATDVDAFPSGRSRLSVDGWTFGGTLSLPLSDALSVFGRGGVFVWDAAIDANGFSRSFADDSDPYYGLGASVALNRQFSLVGDWMRFEFDDADADVFTLGFEYRFGL